MWRWFSRCFPGFSIVLLSALLLVAFPEVTQWVSLPWGKPNPPPAKGTPELPTTLNLAQKIFMCYTTFVHLNAWTFVCRLSWALSRICRETRAVLKRRPASKTFESPSGRTTPLFADSPVLSPSESALQSESLCLDIRSLEEGEPGEVVHAIILPNYCEDEETLKTTLRVLASHPRASTQYEIFLAMEQKELKSPEKAISLITQFEGVFREVCSTFHPANLPGEIAGKSSNVAFAARHIVEAHRRDQSVLPQDVIITVMDADTHLSQDYFNEIRRMHYQHYNEAERSFYASPIIFDRNANEVPIFVRCADLLWGFAGLSAMYPGCSITIPTSVYSLPLPLAEKVGGWDGDATAIGEDMHMLLKCYFQTSGDVITRVVYSAASQCNITGNAGSGASKFQRTMANWVARYRQALRHMWGALDTGFAVRESFGGLVGKTQLGGLTGGRLKIRPRHLVLLHLLFEAHFLPSHLTILLVFSSIYTLVTPAAAIHPSLAWAFWFTGVLRTVSFLWMNLCLSLYDRWHTLSVTARARDMAKAGISDTGFAFRNAWWHRQQLTERICFPIAGTIFGSIPAMHAEISHFWTDRLVYRVSQKPIFASLPTAAVRL